MTSDDRIPFKPDGDTIPLGPDPLEAAREPTEADAATLPRGQDAGYGEAYASAIKRHCALKPY